MLRVCLVLLAGLVVAQPEQPPPPSPILLPTSKRGTREGIYKLTSVKHGVMFDLDGDGNKEWTAWTKQHSDVGFLVQDRDGDGIITSGLELYGNATMPGKTNGFQVLAAEVGGKPSIDATDPLYHKLQIWIDDNHDGESQRAELFLLRDYYTRILTGYKDDALVDQFGNQFRYRGWAEVRTGTGSNKPKNREEELLRTIPIYDVILATRDPNTPQ